MNIKLFVLFYVLGYQTSFFAHNLDKYTVLYPDLIEIAQKQCKYAQPHQKQIIEENVQALINNVTAKKIKSGRSYLFFSVENEFNLPKCVNKSYSFYVILYVEFEDNIFDGIAQSKKDRIEKMIVKHLLKLYENKSIGFKKVLPGCNISCVEIGIEEVSKDNIS